MSVKSIKAKKQLSPSQIATLMKVAELKVKGCTTTFDSYGYKKK